MTFRQTSSKDKIRLFLKSVCIHRFILYINRRTKLKMYAIDFVLTPIFSHIMARTLGVCASVFVCDIDDGCFVQDLAQ